MAWVKGPDADYEDWARLTGDSWWRWKHVKNILNEVRCGSRLPVSSSHALVLG